MINFKSLNDEDYNNPLKLSELIDAIKISNDTAIGPDEIHYQMLKHLLENALVTILQIFNDIWTTGVFPERTYNCQKAFDILKAILKNEPVLLAPNFAKEFKLAVDASDTGAGSVLMQEDSNGVDHPVSYFSKKFNKHQKNYSTIEKECLSLILALQHFEVYLTSSSSSIRVFSDHNPLIFIHKMKNKNQRLLRWSLLLQEYNLDIRHIKGKDNIISDALSSA